MPFGTTHRYTLTAMASRKAFSKFAALVTLPLLAACGDSSGPELMLISIIPDSIAFGTESRATATLSNESSSPTGPANADFRCGEAENLAVVGGIGENFGVACHRSVKANLSSDSSGGSAGSTCKESPVFQHQPRSFY